MPTTLSAGGTLPAKYSIPLYLALIAAGLAGNFLNFKFFYSIAFIFGSIFAMLALQFFGLVRGILAAAIIAGSTYFIWNHPYAIILLSAEVAFVGWLTVRRKSELVLADMLYWIIIGMPLGYLFYHLLMGISTGAALVILIKQGVNGIANTLAARLIFTLYLNRSRSSLLSLKEVICNLIMLSVLWPVLVMLAVASRDDFVRTDERLRASLSEESRYLSLTLETWLSMRMAALTNLAELAVSKSPQQLQPFLEQTKRSDNNFNRVGLMNREAITTAYYPAVDELGKSTIGVSFADRPYIPLLKTNLKPMLSEVDMSRIGVPKPRVGMFVPVVINGAYGGYITGNLNLDQLRKNLEKEQEGSTVLYSLLDKNGNVIMTNRTDQKVMTPFQRGKGTVDLSDKGISRWVPDTLPTTPVVERFNNANYFIEAQIGTQAQWKLILELPVGPFFNKLYESYAKRLILLMLILLAALALAEYISRKMVFTLAQLGIQTRELPLRLATFDEEPTWPSSGLEETNTLINNFREMSDSLSAQFYEIRQINESLQQQVNEQSEELELSDLRFRSFVENANDILITLTSSGIISYVSPRWKQAFGYGIDETIGSSFTRFVHPYNVSLCSSFFQTVLNSAERQVGIEYLALSKDGSSLWYMISASVMKDPFTGVLTLVCITRDINDRKMFEQALEKSAQKYRLMFENAGDSISVIDTQGKVIEANPMACRMLGYTYDETIALNVDRIDTRPELLPDLIGIVLRYGQNKFDTEHIRKDGSTFPVSIDSRLVSWDGQLAILNLCRDITERKQAVAAMINDMDNRYNQLAEQSGTILWEINTNGLLTFISHVSETVFGYHPDEVIGKMHFYDMHPESVRETFKEAAFGVMERRESFLNVEHTVQAKDGEVVWVVTSALPVFNEDGTLRGYRGSDTDITESRKLKEQLQQSQKMEAVGQLAGGLAHDFNNVLSIINGYCCLLQMDLEEVQDESGLEHVEKIRGASARAGELTHSMLAFSRSQVLNPKNHDLNTIVTNVGSFIKRIIGEDIHFRTIMNEISLPVYVDTGQIEQVLVNLSTNARDAMPQGGNLIITTDLLNIDAQFIAANGFGQPGPYAVITVSDTGKGMDKDTRDKIFEPFFTTKEVGKGTGLGLAMVYGIAKQHNGFVDAVSEPGQGASFMVYIPVVESKDAGTDVETSAVEHIPVGSETILLAEDDDDLREFMRKILTKLGSRLILALDGEGAVEKFKENASTVRLVVMDMIMPRKSGKAAYDEMKKIKPGIRALFTSGYSANIIREQGELGEDAEFLAKPVKSGEFYKKIRELLDK